MGRAASIELEDGALVVRHRADGADAAVLARVAARLERAAHPGVVVVRRAGPVAGGFELVVDHAGTPLTSGRLGLRALAIVGAEVASTLADLHARGVVHGRLEPNRVLLRRDGRPVLCGFGPDEPHPDPADDIAALGALLARLVDGPGVRRPDERLRRPLEALAASAQAVPATRRPGARRLAADLRAVSAQVPPSRRPRLVATGGAAAVVVAAVVAAAGAGGGGASDRGPRPRNVGPPPSTTALAPEPACVARPGRPIEAAACGQAAAVDGGAVVIDGRRSAVGRPGDEIVVADLGCAGVLRPAVLRVATGEVLVFSAPAPDGSRAVAVATRIPGAEELVVTTDASGCAVLRARTHQGVFAPIRAVPDGVAAGAEKPPIGPAGNGSEGIELPRPGVP